MISLEEREERRKTIGASEIYKLLNFDTINCQELWELKVGLRDYEEIDNDSIIAGNLLENQGLKYFSDSNKVWLRYDERIPNYEVPEIVCSYDARIKDSLIPVENKIISDSSYNSWKVSRGGNCEYLGEKLSIPKAYYCQLQIQIDTSQVDYGYLNVNVLTEDEVENPIEVEINFLHNKQIKLFKDEELIKDLKRRAKYFAHCMKYKRRPSEEEFLVEYVF